MISVVIPLYNKERQIGSTLRTVLGQTYQDFEIVVVDDGSTDGSAAEVAEFSDPRIRLIHQQNAGVSAARNHGIEEAHGEFIALLDADDEWQPDYLASQMKLVGKYPQCDVFATNYQFKDTRGRTTPSILRNLPFDGEHGILSNYFEVASSSHPPICSITIMARKSAFQSIGGFPGGIKSGEDLLTWARLACRYGIAYDKRALATFNVDGYDVKEKPKRIPAETDFVGAELAKLDAEFKPLKIRHYISHWHKMRSSVYMRLGMRGKSIKEACIGLKYHPVNFKLLAYIAINLLPAKLQPFR